MLVDAGRTDASALWVAAGLQTGGLLGLIPIVLGGSLGRVALSIALAEGALGTVSVLGSLDSIVSVLLAQLILMERLAGRQAAGVPAALTGAILVAAG